MSRTAVKVALIIMCTAGGVGLGVALNRPSNTKTPAGERANRELQAAVSPLLYSQAGNAGAMSALWNATIAAEAAYSQDDTYSSVTPSLLDSLGAHIDFVPSGEQGTAPGIVSMLTAPQHIVMASRTTSGKCIFALAIKAQASSNTYNYFNVPAKGTYYNLSGTGRCEATAAPRHGWYSSIPR